MTAARTFAGFVPQFWIINTIELFERLAFYGSLAFMSLYLNALGYSGGALGLLMAMALTLPYLVSVTSGALAEKYGYRPMTIAAFIGYTAGYTTLAFFSSTVTIVLGLLFVGLGSGFFKAIPAAAISHLAPEEKRNLGFTLYYWAINVGAFVGPIAIAYGIFGAAATRAEYRLAFLLVASAAVVAMFLTILLFRNPTRPQRDKRIGEAFRPMGEAFRDRRFLAVLGVYVGFWVVYSMNFTFMSLYLDGFVQMPSWFPVSAQQSVNPATIILLGIALGALTGRLHALRMMSIGITLFVSGFLIIGFSGTFTGFVIGMVLATVGEVLTQPGFLSFVSRIAPSDRVAIYQSVGFLPIAVGFFIGPALGGPIYDALVVGQGRTALFWSLLSAVGLLTLSGFLWLANHAEADTRAAAASGPAADAPTPRRDLVRSGIPFAPAAIAALVVLAGLFVTADPLATDAPLSSLDATGTLGTWDGTLQQGASTTQPVTLPDANGTATFRLTWSDEAPPGGVAAVTNAPDSFRLRILDGAVPLASIEGANRGTDGMLELKIPHAAGGHTGLTVEVTLVQAGDYQAGGATLTADDANTWNLEGAFTQS